MSEDYKQHYKIFSENVAFAIRALYYHLTLNDTHTKDSNLQKIIDNNARFWLDYRYMCLVSTIIFLGKIFDEDNNTHSISTLRSSTYKNLIHFTKNKLRIRKKELDNLEEYIKNCHELSIEDIKALSTQAKKARKIWDTKGLRNLRNKIIAHDEIMDDETRHKLYAAVKYDDLREVVRILFQISYVLENAETNGKKPNFEDNSNWIAPANVAKSEIEKIFEQLSK